jgi:hypothetical protein
MNTNSYLVFTKTLLVPNNGRVQHDEVGSNRVYTMRVRGEAIIRDTALICQLKLILCCFAGFRTVEFRRNLQNFAEFCRKSGFPLVLGQLARPLFSKSMIHMTSTLW